MSIAFVSPLCSLLLVLIQLIRFSEGSLIGDFFNWILGSLYFYILRSHKGITVVLLLGVLTKWVRSWKILAVIGVIFYIFLLSVSYFL